MIQHQESIYKCCQLNHDFESAICLCIRPECNLQPVCCRLCLEEQHKNHESKQLIPLTEIDKIESLQLNYANNLIQQLENQIKNTLKEMRSLLFQIDVLRQLQDNPSIELLKKISQIMKSNRNYKEIDDILNNHAKSINNQLRKMMNYIKRFQMDNFNQTHEIDLDKLYKIGMGLFHQKRFLEAIKPFDKVLEIDEKHKDALEQKSWSLFRLSQYEESIKYADRVIAIDPQYSYAFEVKSNSLCRLKQYKEALTAIDKALEIDPNDKPFIKIKEQILQLIYFVNYMGNEVQMIFTNFIQFNEIEFPRIVNENVFFYKTYFKMDQYKEPVVATFLLYILTSNDI